MSTSVCPGLKDSNKVQMETRNKKSVAPTVTLRVVPLTMQVSRERGFPTSVFKSSQEEGRRRARGNNTLGVWPL